MFPIRIYLPSNRPLRAIWCAGVLSAVGTLQIAAAADADTDTDAGGLAEIVVTAQRFTSTVQNTPISLSAVTGDQLDAAGITSIEELAHDIPGLSMRSAGPGRPNTKRVDSPRAAVRHRRWDFISMTCR